MNAYFSLHHEVHIPILNLGNNALKYLEYILFHKLI